MERSASERVIATGSVADLDRALADAIEKGRANLRHVAHRTHRTCRRAEQGPHPRGPSARAARDRARARDRERHGLTFVFVK
jgi:hypothetical protein